MLTRKQHELLLYIDRYLGEHGVSPSFEEMKDALDLKSKSGIHRLINALEERGFIKRLVNRARALEVLRRPEEAASRPAAPVIAAAPQLGDNVVRGAFGKAKAAPVADDSISIPLHGKIAAGTPIEALERADSRIAVPAGMLGRGEHYGLVVEGDSMIDMGILDGDTIIVKRAEAAQNGDVVVALVDDAEATLKTFRRTGSDIELKPANSAYRTQVYRADRVRIQGCLVGLLRRY